TLVRISVAADSERIGWKTPLGCVWGSKLQNPTRLGKEQMFVPASRNPP
uniref:Uncharacterized protein n=1 Tax=Aegilops tauschii subsp. strangulata TaxID=200361 RepID=A0A452XQM8_AEGTS